MSCEVTSTRLEIVQGDTAIFHFTITQADCVTLQDLTAFTKIYFTIKRSNQDPDAAALFRGTLVDGDIDLLDQITNTGEIEVTVPPDASRLIRSGRPYFWDVQIETDDANLYTPLYGTMFGAMQSTKSS